MKTPQQHIQSFENWLRPFARVLVAYSGGVDSAVVMALAHQLRGQNALACIGVSPSYPLREQRQAIELAKQLAVPHRIVETREHLDPRYAANPSNRCYYCKTDLYDHLAAIAQKENWSVILDGNNADDVGDDRPGRAAAGEHGVRSPLLELALTKADVRAIARHLNLPVWDKPAMACLSSRVPHGVAITPELLTQIEKSEDVLSELGFRQFRVRHQGDTARIELLPADLPRAIELRENIVPRLRELGYRHVTLDLAGFRTSDTPQMVTVSVGRNGG